jgi:hypothetical protein
VGRFFFSSYLLFFFNRVSGVWLRRRTAEILNSLEGKNEKREEEVNSGEGE